MSVHGYTKNYKLIKPQFDTDTWHDHEYDNLDTIDAVLSAIYASGDWQGFWKNNTSYKAGSVVIDRNTDTMYKVVTEHTTDGNVTFAEYMFNHPEYYQLWSPNNLAKDWAIKDDGLADNQDYSAKAYAVGGVGTENNNAKYYSEQAGIQAEASAEQAAASASSATASYNSEQLALSHANQAASSAASSLTGAEQSAASAAISQEKAEYTANSVAGLESFVQEKQNEINASLAETIRAAEEAKRYADNAATFSIGNIFYTSRLDDELNGAVEANGGIYSVEAFTGEQSVPELLRKGSLSFVSMAEYESIVSANGSCRAWGYDGGDTFRVPLLKDVYLMAGQAETAGEFINESLPNVTGIVGCVGYDKNATQTYKRPEGAFYEESVASTVVGFTGNSAWNTVVSSLDASRSSPTYQNGAKVRPDSVRYRAMVQLSTGVKEDSTQLKEYKFNNPHFFGESKWTDVEPKNSSWLLSNGNFHSGATYVGYYEWLLDIKSGNKTVEGVSVKGVSDEYTDYDFVVNTTDNTFRLPLKTKLASGSAVVGNGMTLGLTNGTQNLGLSYSGNTQYGLWGATGSYGTAVGQTPSGDSSASKTVGITTDPEKSGIETSSNGLKLYFYVGDTVQDASLIKTSEALDYLSKLNTVHCVIETFKSGSSWYRVYDDGWVEQGGTLSVSQVSTGQGITLLKNFKDTNYSVIVCLRTWAASWAGEANPRAVDPTVSGFTIQSGGNRSPSDMTWIACGYGA